jgi:hypothetical protein
VHEKRVAVMFPPLSWIRLFFYRAEAAQGLQRRSRVRDRGVAADSGSFHSVPDFRSASVGDESICHRSDSRVSSRVLYVIYV